MAKTEMKLAVLALIEEVDPTFNPIKTLVQLAMSGQDDGIKLSAAKELASYLYPKQRPVDKDGKTGDITINVLKFSEPEPALVSTIRGEEIAIGRVLDCVPLPEPEDPLDDGNYDTN